MCSKIVIICNLENFAFLRHLYGKDALGPDEVLDLANYLHHMFIEENKFGPYFYSENEQIPYNSFQKTYLKGPKVTELDQDPVPYRRVAQQLAGHLNGWTKNDLRNVATKSESIQLELHVLCAIGTFGRNLLRRAVEHRGLVEEFGNELHLVEMVEKLEQKFYFFMRFCLEKCNKMMK